MSEFLISKTLQVPLQPDHAFELFTARMSSWWPLKRHSISQDSKAALSLGGKVGGLIVEKAPDGTEHVWGTVKSYDPPGGLSFTFHPGQKAETAQLVEVQFTAVEGGTRVDLKHSGWEALGEGAQEAMGHYESGWVGVLGAYEAQAKS